MTEYIVHTSDTTSISIDYAESSPSELNTIPRGNTASYVFPDVIDQFTEYATYAGKFNVSETLSSQQRYSENIPPSASIDTLLVGIEPQTDLSNDDIQGYWGLIETISDERNTPLSNDRVGVDITVLALYSEYADHTAVESELKV